jgi:hypothetical protein
MRRAAKKVDVVTACSHAVGEKDQIEFGGLRSLGELDVMTEIDAGVGSRVGMPPRRNVMSGGVKEGAEAQVPATSAHGSPRIENG